MSTTPLTREAIDAPVPTLESIMEQAQCFASTWSSVGGQFDDGTTMERAEAEKADLRLMVERVTSGLSAAGYPGANLEFLTLLREIIVNPNWELGDRLQRVDSRIWQLTNGEAVQRETPLAEDLSPADEATKWGAAVLNEGGLRPCPFCGSCNVSASVGEKGDGSPYHYVECEECAATAEPEMWNLRAPAVTSASTWP